MSDLVLAARLDALEQKLMQAENAAVWQRKLGLQQVRVNKDVWDGFAQSVRTDAKQKREELRKLRERVAAGAGTNGALAGTGAKEAKNVWRAYTCLYRQSQDLFRECLEFLGGLAFRDKALDESICQIADELILHCAQSVRQFASLTVPARQESLAMTLGRIIRLPFPEWNVWALPLMAHEYGHVVVQVEGGLLSEFATTGTAFLLERDADLAALAKKDERKDEREARARAQFHLFEFIADGFGTFLMGPAYAAAAIHLRLDPTSATSGSEHVAATKRAFLIVEMLRRMSQAAPDTNKDPYKDVIDRLRDAWTAALVHAAPEGWAGPASTGEAGTASGAGQSAKGQEDRWHGLLDEDAKYLSELVEMIWYQFDLRFLPFACYPAAEESEGWLKAREWERGWLGDIEDNRSSLKPPEVTGLSALRDVLNAAWLCRLKAPERVTDIATAARTLCETIISKRDAGRGASNEPAPRGLGETGSAKS